MILMIDNYDSFTYNIVQYLGEMGHTIRVVRNDEIQVEEIERLNPEAIMISPGPCTPNEAGISLDTVKVYAGKIPILGICLGHQTIAQAFGGKVIRADRLMHGKTSPIYHDQKTIFAGIPSPYRATRYHSLIVDQASLPAEFEMTAHTDQGELMAIRHKRFPLEGVQFHPESIISEHGKTLFTNFLKAYTTRSSQV
ncbi:aminodeoxychorismate/anthranilate synthase component II [Hazenella sp. IB182357]|uniref:Aminodeoxychorismate/anthranilate synthase component II n=1 Tax=Polycladospora coralii TaxID=2771432 RepID=A0A926N9V5_9BACL|nr:aminodeoxychorismate/anthranilate synthase component II [Polycladospora coralii]MBD1372443.1 aminodeoxychorismate/anthranilate synthase component II [Polycladospora coralii]MBS7531765.1 aminodeoxychorismate/anthranilate synthase component II [Polycladospora coralii]